MGLDMYLNAHLYVSTYTTDDYRSKDKAISDAVIAAASVPFGKVTGIDVQVAYWRKSNQIHAWFVNNVQGGKDECQESEVSREQLATLHETVKQVLAKHTKKAALELLPPCPGFFFGATDIDKYYWDDLKETDKMLTAILDAYPAQSDWWFVYRASW